MKNKFDFFDTGGEEEAYRLFDRTLEEVIETGFEDEKDEKKEARTNIWMSLWLRKIFADLRLQYDLPLYLITSRMIRLGSAIVQKEYRVKFKRLGELWGKIRWIDNVVAQQLEAHEYTVNGMINAKRTFIRMPKWCSDMLGKVTGSAQSEKAGMIRLSMYHAIARSGKAISEKNKKHAQTEIAKFDKQIDDSIEFLEVIDNHFRGVRKDE